MVLVYMIGRCESPDLPSPLLAAVRLVSVLGLAPARLAQLLLLVLQLEAAVEVALNMTSSEETLTVVTADHSHSFTLSGYANRGTDILGFDPLEPSYLSLMYGTGPGGARPEGWSPPGEPRLAAGDFRYPAAAYRDSAAHQGEEVALYATGPGAHLFRGLLQQHYIPHTLAYAACICLPHYPTCPTYCNQP